MIYVKHSEQNVLERHYINPHFYYENEKAEVQSDIRVNIHILTKEDVQVF